MGSMFGTSIEFLQFRAAEIVKKNFFCSLVPGRHDGSSDLAQSDAMSPSGAVENKPFRSFRSPFF